MAAIVCSIGVRGASYAAASDRSSASPSLAARPMRCTLPVGPVGISSTIKIPARLAQLHGDPAIPVTSVLAGQLQDGPGEAILVVVLRRNIPLRPSPLPQQPAGMPLGKPILLMSMLYRATSPFRA